MDLSSVMKTMDAVRLRKEAELTKLCENPENFDIATALTDALLGNLDYLCNFSYAVSGNGKKVEVADMYDPIREGIFQTFKQLTGREYRPEICRDLDFKGKSCGT